MADKVRENKLRRLAAQQGLRLEKSRRRDPRVYDYGTYQLVNATTGRIVAGDPKRGYGLTLDQVEEKLNY
jgi:hypothetical protein